MLRVTAATLRDWLLPACALLVTGLIVRRELFPPPVAVGAQVAKEAHELDDWDGLVSTGHRIGPESASVTILEFADFECPYCRSFAEKALAPLQKQFPNDVAVVFRHWPLPYHRFAYSAARAAECAGAQGAFTPMYEVLYAKQDSLGLKSFTAYSAEAGVGDTVRFRDCIQDQTEIPAVEADIAAAHAIGARGTPTLAINGALLSWVPDRAELDSLVRLAMQGKPR